MDEKSLRVKEIAQRAQWLSVKTSLSHFDSMRLYGDIDVAVKREMAQKLISMLEDAYEAGRRHGR